MSDVSPEELKEFEEFKAEMEATPEQEPDEAPPEQETVEAPPEQEPVEAPPEPKDDGLTFKIKGEDKKFSMDQIRNTLSREETFQKKFNKMSSSDEYKFGVLMSAAQSGDKGAQKTLLAKMVEFTGAKDGDQMLNQMEEVTEEFNTEEKLQAKASQEEFDDFFDEVKGDVDFEDTLGKIKTDLKARMPEKVFNSYWNKAGERRVMYDLQKSGRADELFSAFEDQLSDLPLLERAKIKTDPDLYGALFVEVVKSQNAKQGNRPSEPSVTPMDSVSSGNRSHSAPADNTTPDWDNMTPEEFKKAEAKMLKKAGLSHLI